jgi:hypothetical protein
LPERRIVIEQIARQDQEAPLRRLGASRCPRPHTASRATILADLQSALAPVNLRVMPHGVPRHRVVLTALLSLFLLFLQQESVRHQLDHLGAQLERAKHSALERPTGDVCLECELLAGGTSLLPASLPVTFAESPQWIAVVIPAAHVTIGAPQFYQSRAPPRSLQFA